MIKNITINYDNRNISHPVAFQIGETVKTKSGYIQGIVQSYLISNDQLMYVVNNYSLNTVSTVFLHLHDIELVKEVT